ncbi:hypothetical protein MASR2M8_10140 [Opitutaceae bacterium]
MDTNLSDRDVERVALRVVELMAQRLSSPPPPPAKVSHEVAVPLKAPSPISYTVKSLAKELGLSPVSIYRLEARGLLKSVPGIRRKIFSRTQIERFLEGTQGGWRRG